MLVTVKYKLPCLGWGRNRSSRAWSCCSSTTSDDWPRPRSLPTMSRPGTTPTRKVAWNILNMFFLIINLKSITHTYLISRQSITIFRKRMLSLYLYTLCSNISYFGYAWCCLLIHKRNRQWKHKIKFTN
jgi:hypothetical protein